MFISFNTRQMRTEECIKNRMRTLQYEMRHLNTTHTFFVDSSNLLNIVNISPLSSKKWSLAKGVFKMLGEMLRHHVDDGKMSWGRFLVSIGHLSVIWSCFRIFGTWHALLDGSIPKLSQPITDRVLNVRFQMRRSVRTWTSSFSTYSMTKRLRPSRRSPS